MRTSISFLLFLFSVQAMAQSSLPAVVNGQLQRIENFQSKYVAARNIDIWLPDGYSDTTKYAVLYMHDGQMLYDPAGSWNKQAWDIDDVAGALIRDNQIKPFIVVGIWNSGPTRHPDYFPQQPFEQLPAAEQDTITAQLQQAGRTREAFHPQSDNYLRFIVQELKPYIDSHFSVYTGRTNTFIMGSSMGGLISMYAICEYPKVFGGAACLSTHWPGSFTLANNPMPAAFLHYLEKHLPRPKKHRLYFDCGDQTLDALYPAIQKQADSILIRKGYTSRNWLTQYFPGADHSEKSWHDRLPVPLQFLLGK